ncbi:MAG TPA: histidine phosphatase family protein [Elusimicrobiales bacterium]|nr:histidine phosphatase family protein [Elusimicrobiales bacterium]
MKGYMEIVFMRHARALSASAAGVATDGERPLSPEGLAQARAAADTLAGRGFVPALIIASPLRRAMQTAEQAAAVFAGAEIRVEPGLASPADPSALARALAGSATGHMLVIGHHPAIGLMAAPFIGKAFSFSTAGFLRLALAGDGRADLLDSDGCEEL